MDSLALTDHDGVYGAVRFAEAARQCGIRPIFGAEITLETGHHLTLLVENEQGWRNLCSLISLGRHNGPKGQPSLPAQALEGRTEGLIALSGCRDGLIPSALLRKDWQTALRAARHYRDLFGPAAFWLELHHHHLPEDDLLNYKLAALAESLGVGCVATNDVHYAE